MRKPVVQAEHTLIDDDSACAPEPLHWRSILDDWADGQHNDSTPVAIGGCSSRAEPPRLLAHRYALQRVIKRGGFGEVWQARDRLAQEDVAVKLVPALRPAAQTLWRRELAAMRWLQLPGVVRLRDEGVEGDTTFLVMDLVRDAQPFPGQPGPLDWDRLAPFATRLLEVLATVHAAGVLHLDLKPGNVLIDGDGQLVLLDFGLAMGRAVAPEWDTRARGLTRRYAAPEQRTGQACTPSTDLYAVGVMLAEALAGPRVELGRWGELPVAAPPHVVDCIAELLAVAPGARPESAAQALHQLGGVAADHVLNAALEALPSPCTVEDLWELFHGPDLFLHLREDAAETLWARTGGDPERIHQELSAWVGAGLAHWREGKLEVRRTAIEQLMDGLPLVPGSDLDDLTGAQRRLLLRASRREGLPVDAEGANALQVRGLLWASSRGALRAQPVLSARFGEHVRSPEQALAAGERLLDQARPLAAEAVLQLGLTSCLADAAVDDGVYRSLLDGYVLAALQQNAIPAMLRAAYELERATADRVYQRSLLGLVTAAAMSREGGQAARGQDTIRSVPRFESFPLEVWRLATCFRFALEGDLADAQETLEGLAGWARTSPRHAAEWYKWAGTLRYRQNLFRESARMHERSAGLQENSRSQLSSRLNAASGYLEALDFDRARDLARESLELAQRLRLSNDEAFATWLLRSAMYRAGQHQVSRPEIPDACQALSSYLESIMAFNEAAIAWKNQAPEVAAELAGRARILLEQQGRGEPATLIHTLEMTLKGTVDAAQIQRTRAKIRDFVVPDFSVQILGLLALSSEGPHREELQNDALHIAQLSRPPSEWGARLDILSYQEAVGRAEPATTAAAQRAGQEASLQFRRQP